MPEDSTDTSVNIMLETAELQEAAERLRRQAEELRQATSRLLAPVTDAQSLHRMADYVQQRADAAGEETRRLQGVADRLRQRAQEAQQAHDK